MRPSNNIRGNSADRFRQNENPTDRSAHNNTGNISQVTNPLNYTTAFSLGMVCEDHNDPITNYCSNLDCLKPLCPDCIDNHYRMHMQATTQAQIESLKTMKFHCTKKVEKAIESLQREMSDCEHRYLLDPEALLTEGIQRIYAVRDKIIGMVRRFFETQEEAFRKSLGDNLLRVGDFKHTFERMNQLINELEVLKQQMNDSNGFLNSLNRICRLDSVSLRDKFKSEIHKIVTLRDLEPVKIFVEDQKIMQLKVDLEQVLRISKSQDQQIQQQQQQHHHQIQQQSSAGLQRPQQGSFGNPRTVQNTPQADVRNVSASKPVSSSVINTAIEKNLQSASRVPAAQQSSVVALSPSPSAFLHPTKFEVNIADFFEEQCAMKNLNYFAFSAAENEENFDSLISVSLETGQRDEIPLDIDFEVPRFHKSITAPDGQVYLIGGTNSDRTKSSAIYRYSQSQGTLILENDTMKEARSSFGVCFLRNCIYVIGGIGANGQYLSSCERFNLKSRKWEAVSSLVLPSASIGCVSFNNRFIFKIGGNRSDKSLIPSIEKYDIMLNKWVNISPKMNVPVAFYANLSCVQINAREIFVFGGYDEHHQASNLSYVLHVTEQKDLSAANKDENGLHMIHKVNVQPLPIAEGFTNSQAVILNNQIHVLQDEAASEEVEEVNENGRSHLTFNGSEWLVN